MRAQLVSGFDCRRQDLQTWRCRAGARYLYICEDGPYTGAASQRCGYPGIPLEDYTMKDSSVNTTQRNGARRLHAAMRHSGRHLRQLARPATDLKRYTEASGGQQKSYSGNLKRRYVRVLETSYRKPIHFTASLQFLADGVERDRTGQAQTDSLPASRPAFSPCCTTPDFDQRALGGAQAFLELSLFG